MTDTRSYEDQLRDLAKSIGSDGCTHALEIHQVCCWEHDWSYVTLTTPRGEPTTKTAADARFRHCNQTHSPFRRLSVMAAARWVAVHFFGHGNFPERFVGQPLITPQTVTMVAALVDTDYTKNALAEAKARRIEILTEEMERTA